MKLPQLADFDFNSKKVLVRCDLDVPLREKESNRAGEREWIVEDDTRIRECLPTIKYLLDHKAEVILLGHIGRPEGKVVEELKMAPVKQRLIELLGEENFTLLENLRFDKREEENDEEFAKELAKLGDFYVNEAFGVSHREHSSIVGVPKFLPHCAGLHFASEVENLSKVLENPKRPLVFVIGGAKPETKLPYIENFSHIADVVLVGGTLCKMSNGKCQNCMSNVKCAELTEDGFDISEKAIKEFCEIIEKAGTVVWNGPMGKYEDEKWEAGTRKIAEAIGGCGGLGPAFAKASAGKGFSVVGGGDTIAALKKFNLIDKMDYISTGGGAMLEFLAKGTLPGIEVLR